MNTQTENLYTVKPKGNQHEVVCLTPDNKWLHISTHAKWHDAIARAAQLNRANGQN